MIGADAIIRCLEAEGVDTVYGYPGVAICPFYNSILDSDIQTILVRTEQNAAHAASGYARISGKPGVCAVTSGPGATNVITGIATAFADSIPLVCITGQVNSQLLGSDVFQEADITGAVESFVKYSYLIKDVDEIPRVFKEAFYIANSGRKGPVLIDIPIDIQNAVIKGFKYPEELNMRTYKPTVKGNTVQIKKVIKELEKAKRPIICAGGGVHISDATDEFREFVHKHNIPVVSTMMGIGVMPTKDDMYFGMVGNNGKAYANRAMNEADLMITLDRRIYQKDYVIAKEEALPMHFVASSSSKFANIKNLHIKDIVEEPFVLTEYGQGYRRVLDRELEKRSLEIRPVLEIGRTDLITSVLTKSNMISFLPDFVTEAKIKSGELCYLDICDVNLEIYKQLIYHKNKWMSSSFKALIEYIKENEFKGDSLSS